MIDFPISGVETYWWLPPLFAFVVSTLVSSAGISGAFLIMPFQISYLGFITPAVTPTNLLFNVFGIPSGVYRFYREKRMVWPLVTTMSAGTVPGLVLGIYIRVKMLPDPRLFKFFVGIVLAAIALRLLINTLGRSGDARKGSKTGQFIVEMGKCNLKTISYSFNGADYSVPTMILFSLSAIVGAIGGIYGIGGGAILVPILVAVYGLPVHTIAGATLCTTMLTSIIGVVGYIFLTPLFAPEMGAVSPDWVLGLMFGLGGAFGIYTGARLQKYLPATLIKIILGIIMIVIASRYIIGFIR